MRFTNRTDRGSGGNESSRLEDFFFSIPNIPHGSSVITLFFRAICFVACVAIEFRDNLVLSRFGGKGVILNRVISSLNNWPFGWHQDIDWILSIYVLTTLLISQYYIKDTIKGTIHVIYGLREANYDPTTFDWGFLFITLAVVGSLVFTVTR